MRPFQELLAESAALHGHACPGQVIGVRMAMVGCREIGIDEPIGSKNMLVFVEIDRCASDSIQAVTGCKLGKRTLKFFDYGKVAATFLNQITGEAVRVLARDDAREATAEYAPDHLDKKMGQFHAYQVMPEQRLFNISRVTIDVPPQDLPGRPISRVPCDRCGEGVNDAREVARDGLTLCRPCADGGYYAEAASASARSETPA